MKNRLEEINDSSPGAGSVAKTKTERKTEDIGLQSFRTSNSKGRFDFLFLLLCVLFKLRFKLDVFADDLHFCPSPPLFILPAVLFQAAHDPNPPPLLQIIGAVVSQLRPNLHIEIGDFVHPVPLILVKAVGGYAKFTEFGSLGRLSRFGIPNEISLEKDRV